MIKKYFLLIFLISSLSACNPVKKILQGGQIRESSYLEKIPFTFEYNIPFITVELDGKSYNFMFDTGAPTVITPELARILNLQPQAAEKISDSQGVSNREKYVIIPNIKIGKLNFKDIGSLIMAPSEVFGFKCMKFDGIIGANLMAKAIWQIDYQNKLLTATDQLSNLSIPANKETISFVPQKWQNTPLVPVKIGEKSYHVTFDTGSNGDITLNLGNYKNEILGFAYTESIGGFSSGVYGNSQQSLTKHIKVPKLTIDQVSFTDQILDFSEGSSNNLGNSLFKHYRIILNWREHKIYMIKESAFDSSQLKTYGLAVTYLNNKPTVVRIYKNSEAEKAGILINDVLININGKDFSNLTTAQACFYYFNSILKSEDPSIALTFLRADKQIKVTLQKTKLL